MSVNLKNLIDFLPMEYKDQDTYKVDGQGLLERFLEICGSYFQEDITEEIDNILDIIDLNTTSETYLNYLWEFLGEMPFAKSGEHTGVPNLSDEQIRTVLRYSISLLKIRGSRKFFEILFKMYGLTCTIVDPTDGDMDEWIMTDPIYDDEYAIYDKNYNYDQIYGCTQCITVEITISGHGFTSDTDEFKAFKQAIDKLFDRFLPYNVSADVYYGFDLSYNYTITATPLIDPTLIFGQITEIPILVTVTSDYADADLRYQVTGYELSDDTWSTTKYNTGTIFYARKGDQRYYFRCVGDTSVTTYVDVGYKYYTKSYSIYYTIASGDEDLEISATNDTITVTVTAYRNYDGTITQVPVMLTNTYETKNSGSTWDLTSAGTYTWVIEEFTSKSVSLTVTSNESVYYVLCVPTSINLTNSEKSVITVYSSNSAEDTSKLTAVCVTDDSIEVTSGSSWAPTQTGTYYFRCSKDNTGNSSKYGTVIAYTLSNSLTYAVGISDERLGLSSSGSATATVWVTSGVYYSDFKGSGLADAFNTQLRVYKDGTLIETITLTDEYVGSKSNYYYGCQIDYTFTSTGTYTFTSVGDSTKSASIVIYAYSSSASALLIQPYDSSDSNWVSLTYSGDSSLASDGKYDEATYQLATISSTCKFYLYYSGQSVDDIELEGSNDLYATKTLITFSDAGTYVFSYEGTSATLTVKEVVPTYTITVNPDSATLTDTMTSVSTQVTVTSDTGDTSNIGVYSMSTTYASPYTFITDVTGIYTFYVVNDPTVTATFTVNQEAYTYTIEASTTSLTVTESATITATCSNSSVTPHIMLEGDSNVYNTPYTFTASSSDNIGTNVFYVQEDPTVTVTVYVHGLVIRIQDTSAELPSSGGSVYTIIYTETSNGKYTTGIPVYQGTASGYDSSSTEYTTPYTFTATEAGIYYFWSPYVTVGNPVSYTVTRKEAVTYTINCSPGSYTSTTGDSTTVTVTATASDGSTASIYYDGTTYSSPHTFTIAPSISNYKQDASFTYYFAVAESTSITALFNYYYVYEAVAITLSITDDLLVFTDTVTSVSTTISTSDGSNIVYNGAEYSSPYTFTPTSTGEYTFTAADDSSVSDTVTVLRVTPTSMTWSGDSTTAQSLSISGTSSLTWSATITDN